MTQHPQPFNRTSFITLNNYRLFTARQVADLIKEHTHTPAAPASERLCDDCNILAVEEKVMHLEQQVKDEREQVLLYLDVKLQERKSDIESSLHGGEVPELKRGMIIGLLANIYHW